MDTTTFLEISNNFSLWLTPLMTAGVAFLVLVLLKEIFVSIARGIRFRYNPNFKESDIVFLDGERAIIVKIGMLTTVFGVTKPDGTYCWRYIPNTRIEFLKLEKIINLDKMKIPVVSANHDNQGNPV